MRISSSCWTRRKKTCANFKFKVNYKNFNLKTRKNKRNKSSITSWSKQKSRLIPCSKSWNRKISSFKSLLTKNKSFYFRCNFLNKTAKVKIVKSSSCLLSRVSFKNSKSNKHSRVKKCWTSLIDCNKHSWCSKSNKVRLLDRKRLSLNLSKRNKDCWMRLKWNFRKITRLLTMTRTINTRMAFTNCRKMVMHVHRMALMMDISRTLVYLPN